MANVGKPSTPSGPFKLELVSTADGARSGEQLTLHAPVRLGRNPDCDITLADPAMSRHHAEIRLTEDGYLLADLGSSNGTWFGDSKISERLLKDGDEFRIGGTVVRFSAPEPVQHPVAPAAKPADEPAPAKPVAPARPPAPPAQAAPPPSPPEQDQAHPQAPEPSAVAAPAPPKVPKPPLEAPPAAPASQPPPAAKQPPTASPPAARPSAGGPPASGTAAPPAPPEAPVKAPPRPAPTAAEAAEPSDLGQVLERWGERMTASGNKPFLLSDNEVAWYVEDGKVEVFTVALDSNNQPTGARTHFVTVEPGQIMFGMDFAGFGMGSGLLAVGKMGSHLLQLRVSDLRVMAQDERRAGPLAQLVDSWVASISRSLTREISPGPVADKGLAPGEDITLENRQTGRPPKAVVWMEILDGSVLFVDMEELSSEADQAAGGTSSVGLADLFEKAKRRRTLYPLTPDSWIEASNPGDLTTRLRILGSATAVSDPALWTGLEAFHRVLCQCEFINKRFAVVDEFNRLKSKAEYSEAAREAAYRDIAAVLEEPGRAAAPAVGAGGDLVLEACRAVGEFLGMEIKNHPEADKQAGFNTRIGAVAKASRCRTRPIVLRDDWWRRDQGPVVGRWEDSDEPVALLPVGSRSYECVDPKTGTRSRVNEELAEKLSPMGVVLYRPFPDGPLSAKDLIKFGARGLKRDVLMLIGMGLALGALGALTPIFTGKLFDSAIPQADKGLLAQFTGGLFMAAFVAGAYKITQSIAVLRIQGKMDYTIQAALWDRLMNLPSTAFRAYSSGDLADRAGGVDAIRRLVAGAGIGAILGSLSSVFYIFLMFKYSLALGALAMVLTFIYVGFTTTANYLQLRHERVQMAVRGKITGMVLQFISGVGKLRVAGAENHAFRVWASDYSHQRRLEFTIGRIQNAVQIFGSGFPVISSMAIFYVLMLIQEQALAKGQPPSMTTGDFIAFNAAFTAFLAATQSLGNASLDMLRVVPIFQRLKPIITTPAELDETRAYPGRLRGEIDVKHASFRYSEEGPWVIDDLSVKIEAGEMVAFVGGSGCGKSTLMRLLLGFEIAQKGSVYFDGQDLANLDLREVRQQIGVVLQTSSLLPTDIFRNIVGSTGLGLGNAWEAAELAGLVEDIKALPMGMHTYIAEGGGGFSGGQKQKILVARALVRKPRILIFDEATSALDNRSQAVVTQSMERLQATRIVIAHRLSTIINADRICYLEGGKVIEQGSYDELMKLDGKFAILAKRQMA
ncbi:MAG: NHLP bacteriocin export ABC transporter permease/ATPase subunit [Acidobacteria bacterium]|nr:NHLP bacteriocin export ABC transporter permease/ATPase subunit [Acidobacteriota bacterium]